MNKSELIYSHIRFYPPNRDHPRLKVVKFGIADLRACAKLA
jgi:hypothetical protein